MRYKTVASYFFTVTLLVASLLSARLETQAAATEDSREVSKLLEDIKVQVSDLQRDSDELESFTRSSVSWESHAAELNLMRDRINTVGESINPHYSVRPDGADHQWRKEPPM